MPKRWARRQSIYPMTIAPGRSCAMAEIDLIEDALKNMINSVELKFRENIDAIKAHLFDISMMHISDEEKESLSAPYLTTLDELETQRFHVRNKLVICIYSICEASLAGICVQYNITIKREESKKNKQAFYLTDYLHALEMKYDTLSNGGAAYVVYEGIRHLRNHLTHGKIDNKETEDTMRHILNAKLNGIENRSGTIIIKSSESLFEILGYCKKMLIESELAAKRLSTPKPLIR